MVVDSLCSRHNLSRRSIQNLATTCHPLNKVEERVLMTLPGRVDFVRPFNFVNDAIVLNVAYYEL